MPTPGARRQARVIALQTLYEYDTSHHEAAEVLARHTSERKLAPATQAYAEELLSGVLARLDQIDADIQRVAPEWPLTQMARIDKNILRLAIYEMLYNNAVPAKAAINEAVELAKQFGSGASSRFVNGVLGALYAQSRESLAPNAGGE